MKYTFYSNKSLGAAFWKISYNFAVERRRVLPYLFGVVWETCLRVQAVVMPFEEAIFQALDDPTLVCVASSFLLAISLFGSRKVCATQYHSRVLLRDRRRASHKGDFIFKEGGWDDDALYYIRCRRRQGCFVWCNTNMPSSARRWNECAARRSAHIRSLNALFSHNECRRAAFCQTFFSRKHSAIFLALLQHLKTTRFCANNTFFF